VKQEQLFNNTNHLVLFVVAIILVFQLDSTLFCRADHLSSLNPNVKPGKTNALLGKYASIIIIAFEETKSMYRSLFGKMPFDNMKHCGNPLRSAFLEEYSFKGRGCKSFQSRSIKNNSSF
jgi:hypothetical protein